MGILFIFTDHSYVSLSFMGSFFVVCVYILILF